MKKPPVLSIAAILATLPDNVATLKVMADGSFEVSLSGRSPLVAPKADPVIPLAPGVLGASAAKKVAVPPEKRKPKDVDSLTRTPPASIFEEN